MAILRWGKVGSTRVSSLRLPDGTYIRYEIDRHEGYDKLAGGNFTDWRFLINDEWDETFSRLKDAKVHAERTAEKILAERTAALANTKGGEKS